MSAVRLWFLVLLKFGLILLVSFFAPRFISYLGSFSYPDFLDSYQLPQFVRALANFDGVYYLRIAQNGYSQYEQVFFPLYPLLIRLSRFLFGGSELLAGLAISNLSFWTGLYIFSQTFAKNNNQRFLLSLIIFFPTAFFFQSLYTESLFFLFVVLTFYYCRKQKLLAAAVFGFSASLTRLMGLFLVIPIILASLKNKNRKLLLYSLGPILGLGVYMFYLWQTTGDPLFFFHSQAVFGESRSTSFILLPQVYFRYFKILFTADWSFAYFVAVLEMLFFTAFLIVLSLDLKKQIKVKNFSLISLNLFSLVNILLPTLTGSFMSIPRFSLLSLSFYLYLATLKNKMIKSLLIVFFALFQAVLLCFFIQGYFIS